MNLVDTPEAATIGTKAIAVMRPSIELMMAHCLVKRTHLYIMVAEIAPEFSSGYILRAYESFGYPSDWEHPYDEIARGKTRISARTGLSSREVHTMRPHLLVPGDVKYWGNAIGPPFIVSCSGVEPWFDEAISNAVLGLCKALTQRRVERMRAADGSDFFGS